jgi:hypothetical protein
MKLHRIKVPQITKKVGQGPKNAALKMLSNKEILVVLPSRPVPLSYDSLL